MKIKIISTRTLVIPERFNRGSLDSRLKHAGMTFLLGIFLMTSAYAENLELTALIEKGETLIKQGSYSAGISILEAVLTKDPENSKVLNSLLTACDSYSQKLISEKRFDLAQSYMKKMNEIIKKMESLPEGKFSDNGSSTQPRIKREMAHARAFMLDSSEHGSDLVALNAGREMYNEAVSYFNKHQYDIAENLLLESIKLDQSNSYAYELLGEIANLNHRLADAERYYKQAFLINSDPALRDKYEKLIREKKIDRNQQQYEDEHFIIKYRRSESIEGSEIRQDLREAYREISQELGHYPKYKIPVVLYDREEYQALMGSVPHWSGALYDGKIRLPVYMQSTNGEVNHYDRRDLKKLIYHELTHAFILDLSQAKCPVWLNEGLAQYQENKIRPVDFTLLRQAVKNGRLLSTDELMFEDVSKITSHEKAVLYYLESFSLVTYLLKEKQMYQIKQLLIEMGKGTAFAPAFEKSFGRSFSDISSSWQRDLSQDQNVIWRSPKGDEAI